MPHRLSAGYGGESLEQARCVGAALYYSSIVPLLFLYFSRLRAHFADALAGAVLVGVAVPVMTGKVMGALNSGASARRLIR